MPAQRMLFGQEVRVVGPGAVEHRARYDDQSLDLGGRAGVHHVKASDRLEFVVHLEVGGRVRAKGRVNQRLGPLAVENLRQLAVGRRIRQIDTAVANAIVHADGASVIDAEDPDRRLPEQESLDEPPAEEGPESGNRDDARFDQ